MDDHFDYVYARVGRAGLGNELFPVMRALEYGMIHSATVIPPKWGALRIGPWLRNDRDKRTYWRLFDSPSSSERITRAIALRRDRSVRTFVGMGSFFEEFELSHRWHADRLARVARRGVLSEPEVGPYISAHVRLGDFARPTADVTAQTSNNVSTPIEWYEDAIQRIRQKDSTLPVLISSDGTDLELRPLLDISGVRRTAARNALDEIFIMSRGLGIIGSRSTFTAWGAYLGGAPLLVMPGANAYRPHDRVWEAEMGDPIDAWWTSVARADSA
ncbi:alpha-1,2-fucosyltransferase [Microbacterium sp. NPDC058062]|uniref:alpha-1,2-fucosyltransferase n=1 Tax=Microbacterium sp. NPDC058062 TaxID=3346320 RepID=UPI0036D75AF5